MMKSVKIMVDEIYVPVKFRDTLDTDRVSALAESIIEDGQTTPINVRRGKDRYVLVSGFHRLEALRALGETTVDSYVVAARRS